MKIRNYVKRIVTSHEEHPLLQVYNPFCDDKRLNKKKGWEKEEHEGAWKKESRIGGGTPLISSQR